MPKKNITSRKMLWLAFLALAVGIFLLVFKFPVFAQGPDVGLEAMQETGLGTQDIRVTIAKIIRVVLGFLGIIGVSLVLYAGYTWMTAAGNPEKIDKARKILINAGIGLMIILSAYGIVSFIIGRLTGDGFFGGGSSRGGVGSGGIWGALGSGIIESHYPARNATGIARNTKIMVTFKEAMKVDTIINNNDTPDDLTDDKIVVDNIKIRQTIDDPSSGPFVAEVAAFKTEDDKTFVFVPKTYLGSGNREVPYTVILSPDIKKANGDAAFASAGGYEWKFEVSTFIDLTPPKIIDVIPRHDEDWSDPEPRNVIIQINFNEAVDPTAVSGKTSKGFDNISARIASGDAVPGTFEISNQYRTVEFLSDQPCDGVEKNSCGDRIYCLPGDEHFTVTAKAASLSVDPPQASLPYPYNGVADVAGNSLDGNSDGMAEGPGDSSDPKDNYQWQFSTNDQIDVTPPIIESTKPTRGGTDIDLRAPLEALFSKFMMAKSLRASNIGLENIPFWISAENSLPGEDIDKTTVFIKHDEFTENTDYTARATSGLKDIYQNCYQPCVGP